jgi:hypothetical protein
VANTTVIWPGRLRQILTFFRNRSPSQILAMAAPWTGPRLPPGYEQNFWNAAQYLRWFQTGRGFGALGPGRIRAEPYARSV